MDTQTTLAPAAVTTAASPDAPPDVWITEVETVFYFLFCSGLITAIIGLIVFRLIAPTVYVENDDVAKEHVQVVVMGDIGRSPRMQYHAISFAKHGYHVDLIGYKETARHPSLISKPNVSLHPLTKTPEWLAWQTGLFVLPLRVLYGSYSLFHTMSYRTPPPKWILLQNPPSIPTFHIALLIAWLRGSKVIIDWHNYGHTIMALNRSKYNPGPHVYRFYETILGRYTGDLNLTVTHAMARQLVRKPYSITSPILTLHDCPAATFKPVFALADRLRLLSSIPDMAAYAAAISVGTLKLIISSTSWTPDEDFGIFLDALVSFAKEKPLPADLLVIVTGKGLQKAEFEKIIKKLEVEGHLPNIKIRTAWLSTQDYATLLSCADLGVCLHKSSSGVDLPMKVVDMFGAGIPVAAYSDYESFPELVIEGKNGCGFTNAAGLAEILKRLLAKEGQKELEGLKKGAIKSGKKGWDEQWDGILGRALGIVKGEGVKR